MNYSNKSLEIDSNSAFAWAINGKALAALGRYDTALISFNKSLEIDSSKADT